MDYKIVHQHELPTAPMTLTATFEGYRHQASISFFWVALPPGQGVRLHRHPCEETFAICAGWVTFTIGSTRLDAAGAGDIITVAPHVPISSGTLETTSCVRSISSPSPTS